MLLSYTLNGWVLALLLTVSLLVLHVFGTKLSDASGQQFIDDYLHTQLTAYELLPPPRLISRRSVSEDQPPTQHLHVTVFRRQLSLVLKPISQQPTAPHPPSISVRQGDTLEFRDLDPNNILSDVYTGYIDDEPESWVSGYQDDGKFHLTIYEDISDVLNIEPLSLLTGNRSEMRLLAYYDSSISVGNDSYKCGLSDSPPQKPLGSQESPAFAKEFHRRLRRSKISPPEQNASTASGPHRPRLNRVCRLKMIADHTFVDHVGSVPAALKFLIKAIDDVNSVYESVVFETADGQANFTGMGFEIESLEALAGPTAVPASDPMHFNAPPSNTNAELTAPVVLEAFGDYQQHGVKLSGFCLCHLVTFRRIKDRVLGLAFKGSQLEALRGGICSLSSPSKIGRGDEIARNIGMTTFRSQKGGAILARQGILVIAHELGHNLGSSHDPSSGKCNPGPEKGGHYLMHNRAVTGKDINHSLLSPCSKREIAGVLRNRSAPNTWTYSGVQQPYPVENVTPILKEQSKQKRNT